MINEETLKNLYEGIVNGNELTTKELNSYGFNSKDLSDLIEQGSLERIKRGYYSFLTIDDLFYYGKKLIAEKEYGKATKCFEKCYELDSTHSGACFQLFLRSINKKDYEAAFRYFDVLSNTDNPYYSADSNFYLYLLSIITNIPEKYKDYARYLKMEDIRVNFHDKRYEDIPAQNKIRIAVLQRKFPYALKQLKDLTAKHGTLTVQDIITRTLLFQAVEAETLSKNTLLELAKTKQYDEIISYLEGKQQRHNLSLTDSYTLKLTKELLNIQDSHISPEKRIFQTEKLFEAIDGCNYELALQLSNSYNQKNNINSAENTINLLLSDMVELIHQLAAPTQRNEEERIVSEEIEMITEEPIVVSQPIKDSNATFSAVIGYLMKSDLENAFRTLRNYMTSINKSEYEFLIIDLIKLSLIEKDIAFTKPMIALTYVSRENFNFDISSYIQDFYVTLSQNRFDESRIYLDIISKANKIGQECVLTEGLLQVLNSTEQMLQYKRNNSILDDAEQALEKSKKVSSTSTKGISVVTSTTIKQVPPVNVEKTVIEVPATISKENKGPIIIEETISLETRNSEREFIESKHDLLLNGQGMILLKPMNSERRKRVHEMVKEYSDMVSFSIGEGENRQIVLRYKPFIDEYVDIKNLIKFGDQAYKDGNYDECIQDYLQILQFGKPKAFVYAKLGLAYMKKWNKEQAIDYLTIATYVSKQENGEFDFTELIASLKGLIAEQDKKPRFKMRTEEFENDIENYYGIENFEKITSYISESGLDVESACEQLEMNEEQIDTILLIYAREYYAQGNYDKGDQFLKSVEKSESKTKFTAKLLDEIRKNKRFYINRANDKHKSLSLTLKPKKIK